MRFSNHFSLRVLVLSLLTLTVLTGVSFAKGPRGRRVARTAASIGAKSMGARVSKTEDGGYHAREGRTALYLPPWFHAASGVYDVVLHFHGTERVQESNVRASHLNAAVLSVNLGVGSEPYARPFRRAGALDALLAKTARLVAQSGRAPGARVGRVALSAWSAGFASVSALLKDDPSRVDAVLLADGLHTSYADPKTHELEERGLAKYARFAQAASRGEKLFVLTHSSIPTYGYANVADTVSAVLRLASLDQKAAPPSSSPRHMRAVYQVNRGDLHVTGYEGTGVSDHVDHIWAMGETMYPLLAARWNARS